jgi:hypothetical protein
MTTTPLPTNEQIDFLPSGAQLDNLIHTLSTQWLARHHQPSTHTLAPPYSTDPDALDNILSALTTTNPCLRTFGPFHLTEDAGQLRVLGGWYRRGSDRQVKEPLQVVLIGKGSTQAEATCKVIAKALVLAFNHYSTREAA